MLTGNDIDLNSPIFWAVAFAAIVALNLVTIADRRPWIFAIVNALFLAMLLKGIVIVVLLALALFYLAMAIVASGSGRLAVLVTTSGALAVLFLINKLRIYFPEFAPVGSVLSVVGFSFIMLRAIDAMRAIFSGVAPRPSPVSLFNYLVPFHMLAAGPIMAYEDHCRAPFTDRPRSSSHVIEGAELIARGLFNKFVLCSIIDQLFLDGFKSPGIFFVIEVLMFTLWSFLDFSAYSNIALGIGRLAGINTPINFRDPLQARNVIDFWDRWHISLSQFVKRNVFTPIQIALMRRPGKPRPLVYASLATGVSFTLVGLWHGLSPGWLIWGMLHALGLIGVRVYGYFLQRRLSHEALAAYRQSRLVRVLATAVTYCYVAFAFVPVAMLSKVAI